MTLPTQSTRTSHGLATRRKKLHGYVGARAEELQTRYVDGDPSARAALATLRRSVGRPAGSDPDSWQIVFAHFPSELVGTSDEPNVFETAAHAALSLFAVHMQSQRKHAHVRGQGLGQAVRYLATGPDDQSPSAPVIRRFHTLGTAADLQETLYHARGLIQQLRAAEIGLDYGQLADDLVALQIPGQADGVRLRWARDLYKHDNAANTQEEQS